MLLSYLPRKRRIVLVAKLVNIFTDDIVSFSVDRMWENAFGLIGEHLPIILIGNWWPNS